jgi:hypothetical protein
MSRLYLICGLCGRRQADGLLSRGYWGHLTTGNGQELRACPTCKEQHTDWEARLLAGTSPSAFPQAGASSGAA